MNEWCIYFIHCYGHIRPSTKRYASNQMVSQSVFISARKMSRFPARPSLGTSLASPINLMILELRIIPTPRPEILLRAMNRWLRILKNGGFMQSKLIY